METAALNTGLEFGEPAWLWALVVVPVLAFFYWRAQARRDALVSRIVAPRLRAQLVGGVNLGVRWLRAVLILLSIALVIVALAKPRMGYIQREMKTKGRDVILAIDTSRSMLATDVTPTRLARAKLVSQDLMRLLRGDRIGLVAFAGSAFLQAPLTLDYNAVLTTLEEMDTEVIPRGGSNLAAAIQTAIDAFGKAEGVLRALVILTDGEELDADGVAAAKRAGEAGIRIFTVGIGSADGSLIPIETPDGRQDFVRDRTGQPVQSKLDSARLGEIAEVTGGFYTALTPDVAAEIFRNGIEPLERQETGVLASRQPIEQYEWPLGVAIGLLVIWFLLGEGRKPRTPSGGAGGAGRRRVQTAARLAVLGLVMLPGARAEDGFVSYEAGDFPKALEAFEGQRGTVPETEKLEFNAGAAAYKTGDYAKAVEYFTGALLAEEAGLREDAAYNLANSLVRRGEAAKSVEARKTDWQDAIDHYTAALELDPNNRLAEENRAIVEKMLEDLEKEQEQQEQKQQDQQQKQDQEDQQDENKNKQEQDQQKQDEQNQDEQKQDQESQGGEQEQKDQEGQEGEQDQQEQEGQGGEQEPKDQEGQEGQENQDKQGEEGEQGEQDPSDQSDGQDPTESEQGREGEQDQQQSPDGRDGEEPAPAPTPGEKKEGELGSQGESEPGEAGEQQEGEGAGEAEEVEGEMSEAQARNLLRSLQGEEDRVRMMERRALQDQVTRDW